MSGDPLNLLRAAIDDSMSHAAAERIWNRAQRRGRELDRSGGWTLRFAGAVAVVCAIAISAPSASTSISVSSSNNPLDVHKVPGQKALMSLVAGKFWCDSGQEPDDTPITDNGMYAESLALCLGPTNGRSLPVQFNDSLLQTRTAAWNFPEIWWSKYALLSHGFQLCYSLQQGRVAVLPVTTPDGQRLLCSNLVILKSASTFIS